MILAPTALAAGFGGSSITTAVADSGARNFTPTEAANDTEIQAMTDNSSVLNESDIIYMILTDRFYDADPTNNGTLNQEYRPGQLKYTQGGDRKGITLSSNGIATARLPMSILLTSRRNRINYISIMYEESITYSNG